jgi:uncharacterized protein YndB with AHSA1/START domain
MSTKKTIITTQAVIQAPIKRVWEIWTNPSHIIHWNNASDDWHTTKAENDLRVGGKFMSRMEAKDGSEGFDFSGKYDNVELYKQIDYTLDDDRKVQVTFDGDSTQTTVTQNFEAESMNSIELQQMGWQAILDNFKKYTESTKIKIQLHYEISIYAHSQKVYNLMLAEKTYSEWTKVFNPTSRFVGSWEKGSKIIFLGTGENGQTGGMISRIDENIPAQFVSIKHMGIIDGETEITSGPEVEEWAGMTENYTFTPTDSGTLLSVDMGSTDEYEDYFNETYPQALLILKEICEKTDL